MTAKLSILFNKKASAQDRAGHVQTIKALPGIADVRPIFPDKQDDPDLAGMYIADLNPKADTDSLIKSIKAMPSIKSAYIPPARGIKLE